MSRIYHNNPSFAPSDPFRDQNPVPTMQSCDSNANPDGNAFVNNQFACDSHTNHNNLYNTNDSTPYPNYYRLNVPVPFSPVYKRELVPVPGTSTGLNSTCQMVPKLVPIDGATDNLPNVLQHKMPQRQYWS